MKLKPVLYTTAIATALVTSASAATIAVESVNNFLSANSNSSNGSVVTVLAYEGLTLGTITYTLTNVDLTSEGGTNSETIQVVLNLSSTGGNLDDRYDIIGVGNQSPLGPGESVTVTGGSVTSGTFGGTLIFNGFTNMQTDSLRTGTPNETAQLTTSAGTNQITGTDGPTGKYGDFGFAASNSFTVAGETGEFYVSGFDYSITAVPEPSSTVLLGLGGLALILRRRK